MFTQWWRPRTWLELQEYLTLHFTLPLNQYHCIIPREVALPHLNRCIMIQCSQGHHFQTRWTSIHNALPTTVLCPHCIKSALRVTTHEIVAVENTVVDNVAVENTVVKNQSEEKEAKIPSLEEIPHWITKPSNELRLTQAHENNHLTCYNCHQVGATYGLLHSLLPILCTACTISLKDSVRACFTSIPSYTCALAHCTQTAQTDHMDIKIDNNNNNKIDTISRPAYCWIHKHYGGHKWPNGPLAYRICVQCLQKRANIEMNNPCSDVSVGAGPTAGGQRFRVYCNQCRKFRTIPIIVGLHTDLEISNVPKSRQCKRCKRTAYMYNKQTGRREYCRRCFNQACSTKQIREEDYSTRPGVFADPPPVSPPAILLQTLN